MKIDVSGVKEMGSIIMDLVDSVKEGENHNIIFMNGHNMIGMVSIVCDNPSTVLVRGSASLPGSDKGIEFDFETDGDFPDFSYRLDGNSAEFYAAGCSWNKDNAPPLRQYVPTAESKYLTERAKKAYASWSKKKMGSKTIFELMKSIEN